MAAPNVQLGFNDEVVKVMWSADTLGTYSFFNLYWSTSAAMAGEAKVASNIPNIPDAYYSKEHITYAFKRATLGLANTAEFYLRLKGVSLAGIEDAGSPGATKLVPSITAQREEYNAAQIYGFDPVKGMWKKVKVGDDGTLAT
jgi:hypothetical protein